LVIASLAETLGVDSYFSDSSLIRADGGALLFGILIGAGMV
jgi:hypothetical protein